MISTVRILSCSIVGLFVKWDIVNETEEWFYQLKGKMCLRIVENDAFRDVIIEEGQMFLLPGELYPVLLYTTH